MDSTDDCFDLLESGLSAIDVDDQSGDAIVTILQSRRRGRFPLMRLPIELRLHALSFLLPDVETIDPGNEWDSSQDPGSFVEDIIGTTLRHDRAPCQMAILRSSRQIYEETSHYLYDKLTIAARIRDDGVNFLRYHYGCGCLAYPLCQLANVPFSKFKCVWLKIEASTNQPKHLVNVRRNLLDFCGVLYQQETLKCVRVDLWDVCNSPIGVPNGMDQRHNYYIIYPECPEGDLIGKTWRAANSTGTNMVATDIELILQPLKLLRNVSSCQIFLSRHLQHDLWSRDLVARHKEIIESKTWYNLMLVFSSVTWHLIGPSRYIDR